MTSHSGAFLRTPDGNVEDVAEMKAAGMEWLAANVGDHPLHAWDTVRARANMQGIPVMPWLRLGHPEAGDTTAKCLQKLDWLYQACDAWGEQGIPNVETEFKTILIPAQLDWHLDNRIAGISTVGWLYNDTDYSTLWDLPILLQVFPADMRFDGATQSEQKMKECVYHARVNKGFKYVGVTFQTYAGAKPEWYSFHDGNTRSWFTGDDIQAGNWGEWAV